MTKISKLVREELAKLPLVNELGDEEIVNITAVAKKIKNRLEKLSGKKLNLTTISMAIRRCLKEMPKIKQQSKIPKCLDLTTRSNLFEIAVAKNHNSLRISDKLRQVLKLRESDFFSVFQGVYEIVFFTNSNLKKELIKNLKGLEITSKVDELAFITVNWSPETKEIPGIYLRITRELALNQISIQSMHTIGSEMMIVLKERNLTRGQEILLNIL